MEPIRLWLEQFGAAGWIFVWAPMLFWSFFALSVWMLLKATGFRLHPAYHHAVRLAVIIALPLGIMVTVIISRFASLPEHILPLMVMLNDAMAVQSLPEIIVTDLAEETADGGLFTHIGSVSVPVWLGLGQVMVLTVGVGLLIRHGWNHVRLVALRHNELRPASQAIHEAARDLLNHAGADPARVELAVGDVEVPFTFGWLRPVIVLPDREFNPEKLRSLLAHEIMHVRHNDYLIEWMVQVLRAVCWFHPLVQVYARDVHRYREMLCDAEVISGMIADPRSYASLLLEFSGGNRQPALSVMISMATTESRLKERILAMPTYPKSPEQLALTRRTSILTAFLIMATLLFTMALTASPAGDVTMQTSTQLTDIAATPVSSHSSEPLAAADSVYRVAEKMPEPVGGMSVLYNNVRYPESARADSLEGRVLLQFVVSERGEVIDPRVVQGIRPDLDQAALQALEGIRFFPGIQDGEPVKVQFMLPIVFRLQPGAPPPPRNQDQPASHNGEDVFIVVEQMPSPIGGLESIYNNIRYPEAAREAGVEGRVVVQFLVDKEGNVVDPFILRGIGYGADEMALDAIKEAKFTPGVQRGVPVNVVLQLPIVFRLDKEEEQERGSRERMPDTGELDALLNDPAYEHIGGSLVRTQRSFSENSGTGNQFAELRGRVRDRSHLGFIAGANVLARHDDSGREYGASTDPEGNFLVRGLPPGNYSIEITYPGYHRRWFGFNAVDHGEILWADVVLGIP